MLIEKKNIIVSIINGYMINTPSKHVIVTIECHDQHTQLVTVQQEQYTLEADEILIGHCMVYASGKKVIKPLPNKQKKLLPKK